MIVNDQSNQVGKKVFISYAKADIEIAEMVEARLTEAGFRVFRDRKDVRPSQDIYVSIDRALDECESMVFLASPDSMPYHRESYVEWLDFDLTGKPIYPLYLEDCKWFKRLLAYKYIDARNDLRKGIDQLVTELAEDFVKPDPMSAEEFSEIRARKPVDLREYRLGRIAEWSLPRHQLDKRFVNLTLSLDRGENAQERWQPVEEFRSKDLREVLEKTKDEYPVLVLLGKPGSGKSTLLRRMQLDHSLDRIRDGGDEISFFIQLNGYHAESNGELPSPLEWLKTRWTELHPQLGSLETWLDAGRVLLLLDALNEMPRGNDGDYDDLVKLWREFAQAASKKGNRIVFSCRNLDYSVSLSTEVRRVPHITVQPMDAGQMQAFLKSYVPEQAERIWNDLKDPRQFELYQTPYFLKLLCEVIEWAGTIPKGRAGLFTIFVRKMLDREKEGRLFKSGPLLDRLDHLKLTQNRWSGPFDLPESGALIPQLSSLAYAMQNRDEGGAATEVRVGYQEALSLIDHSHRQEIIDAGMALSVLDIDLNQKLPVAFFHQLLQEYFASRRLASDPKPDLVYSEWRKDKVSQTYQDAIKGKSFLEPVPPLPQTGWEETVMTAVPMAEDPEPFIRGLIPHNLPLAARCAASPDLTIDEDRREALRKNLQDLLRGRMRDPEADLRARISAGEALGLIGHPEFKQYKGPVGEFILPPLVRIESGEYPIGDNKGLAAHKIHIPAFEIGKYPVTNAEYEMFINAGGYRDETWWDTEAAREWLSQNKESEPEYWNDIRFNNPLQPVVGVSWYEARAYCNWLTANVHGVSHGVPHGVPPSGGRLTDEQTRLKTVLQTFRLPTEAEFEAAARGREGRIYPYGNRYDPHRCNTMDNSIGRTTPVGIFENDTPEGACDLSGNVWTWTLSLYKEYPYRNDDGREDINVEGLRVLRGGSWRFNPVSARAVYRDLLSPGFRNGSFGFRVVVRPPSL